MKIIGKEREMGMGKRTRRTLRKNETNANRRPISCTLRERQREYSNDRRKHDRIGNHAMTGTKRRKHQTDSIRKPVFEKNDSHGELELLAVVLENFRFYLYGKKTFISTPTTKR